MGLGDPAQGRFLYVSPSIRNLRGFTPEEVMAAPFEAGLTPDSRDLVRREGDFGFDGHDPGS